MPRSMGASGQTTPPSRKKPMLVMPPSATRPSRRTRSASSKPGALGLESEVDLAEAADVLDVRDGPLVHDRQQALRARRRLHRRTHRHLDHRLRVRPMHVHPDGGVLVAGGVTDEVADAVGVQARPEELAGGRVEAAQVRVQAADPSTPYLHGGEVAVVDQGRVGESLGGRRRPLTSMRMSDFPSAG
ncbi:hypothetical protein LUX57_22440 [Actinomadura madurae]|nr:hypothetical protein [Actinomadura madurae]MCP9967543.1 hypothetical protein [Actinomadura madurae]